MLTSPNAAPRPRRGVKRDNMCGHIHSCFDTAGLAPVTPSTTLSACTNFAEWHMVLMAAIPARNMSRICRISPRLSPTSPLPLPWRVQLTLRYSASASVVPPHWPTESWCLHPSHFSVFFFDHSPSGESQTPRRTPKNSKKGRNRHLWSQSPFLSGNGITLKKRHIDQAHSVHPPAFGLQTQAITRQRWRQRVILPERAQTHLSLKSCV